MSLKRILFGGPPPGGPTGATRGELNRQGHKGRPESDLSGWAESRGLEFRGGRSQLGYLLATCPWSEDVLFNVCRGTLPGGEEGVVCHEARLMSSGEAGSFYGQGAENTDTKLTSALSFVMPIGSEGAYRVPYTVAGTRIGHLPAVRGLHVMRETERITRGSAWRTDPIPELRRGRWATAVRKRSDEEVVGKILAGPLQRVLDGRRDLGFEFKLEYGQLVVARQQFLDAESDLDDLARIASELTQAIRPLCAPAPTGAELDDELPEPEWLEHLRSTGGEYTMSPQLARLDRVAEVAGARRLAIEDPAVLHASFPGLDIAGEAFGVLRGPLPGSGRPGRLISCVERPMALPEEFRRVLTDPGGPTGSDCAVLAISPDAPQTPPGGESEDGARLVVRGGALMLRRMRPSWQMKGEALDTLAAEAVRVADRRGLL